MSRKQPNPSPPDNIKKPKPPPAPPHTKHCKCAQCNKYRPAFMKRMVRK